MQIDSIDRQKWAYSVLISVKNFDKGFLLAFLPDKCDNAHAMFFLVRDASVMGFMSGGMVIGTVSEGVCNCLL